MKPVAMDVVTCSPSCDGQCAHIHTLAQVRADAGSPPGGVWANEEQGMKRAWSGGVLRLRNNRGLFEYRIQKAFKRWG